MKISLHNNVLQNVLTIISLFLISPLATFKTGAQYDPCEVFGNCITGVDQYENTSASRGIIGLILNFVYFLIYIGGALAVLFIVIGAYKMITSAGNDASYKSGKESVTNAVIGLILAIISVTIVTIITRVVPGLSI